MKNPDRYTHGHHESVLRSHTWRTAQNSAAFLLTHLSPEMSLLDVGCGPGTVTLDLANWMPNGHVTGIDLSPDVIDIARAAQRTSGATNVTFNEGDVYNLAYDDESFDVVYAHQVLQHLSDPVKALGQMRRVVRTGGIVALRESDFGGFTWSPDNERLDRWMEIYQALTKKNNVDANAGRHLHAWVRAAGFTSLEVSSSNWIFYRPQERAWWGQLWADRVRESEFAHQSVEYGLTTRKELQQIAEGFLTWANDVDGIFTLVNTEVLAKK
jgi:ubiquinone/menaquinone biosynthesis C-methylase UbiE